MASGERTTVYTDGACSGNPGPGGWAWAVPGGPSDSGGEDHTTNNRMELIAVHEAIEANPGPLHVVTDSVYVKDGIEKWRHGWQRNGWRTKAGPDVKNRDLWEPLCSAVDAGEVTFGWVKGHSGDPMNDLVDQLAVEQRDKHKAAVAGGVAEAAGASAAGAGAAAGLHDRRARDGRIPEGWLLAAFGQPEVGDDSRRRLAEWFAAQAELHPDLVVLTGLRQGAEEQAALAAAEADVPFVAVLPYPDPEVVWPVAARERFRELCDEARSVVVLEKKVPADKEGRAKALARRDGWLTSVADAAVLVWDGSDRRLAAQAKKLDKAFQEDLLVVDP